MSDIADPTGVQHDLRSPGGRATAQIAQLGASLRHVAVDGLDVVPPYPHDAPTPAASGLVLVPWPNRVRDGKWAQRGTSYQLSISEPALGNASHGLLRFAPYRLDTRTDDAAVLSAEVFPQTGYPFHLVVTVRYALGDDGLHVVHEVRNVGAAEAPVAVGQHPYLSLGGVPTADLVLRSPGATRFVVDDRKLPVGREPVDGATDLRGGRRLGDLDLDTAYGDLARDPDGRARTSLTAPDGRRVSLWQGEGLDFVQVFTTDRYPGQELAVAIEPMSAPADALNSGIGLHWLPKDGNLTREWGLEWLM
jgi:aldose 1-epimerase